MSIDKAYTSKCDLIPKFCFIWNSCKFWT